VSVRDLSLRLSKAHQAGWLQLTVGGGKRSTSATSYLEPIAQRKNLHVLLHAQVTRLVNPSRVSGKLTFGGVEFVQPGNDPWTFVCRF
jgi:choline dehydrogenase